MLSDFTPLTYQLVQGQELPFWVRAIVPDPPKAKSLRTYYLWPENVFHQRKPPSCILPYFSGIKVRATSKLNAYDVYLKKLDSEQPQEV